MSASDKTLLYENPASNKLINFCDFYKHPSLANIHHFVVMTPNSINWLCETNTSTKMLLNNER